MPSTPQLHRHQLENGLRLVLLERHDRPLVAVNLWYHVGSKHERRGRTGLAHLFEHMLFQGSKHVAAHDHFRWVQQVGGVANGSTWYDRTNYFETLPAHQLELGLWLESDRMGFLLDALTSEKLETQRSVVMNERRQRVDNRPYGRAVERLHELLYPYEHPYSWPVIGLMDDIAAATLGDVRSFFESHYLPSNAVLTLVGDFETSAALEAADRWFGGLRSAPAPAPVRFGMPAAPAAAHEVMEDDVGLPRVYLASVVPPYGSDVWNAAHLLTSILSGGKASRLHQELVYERRIAQDVSAFVYPTEECATFLVVATARQGVDPGELAAGLASVIDAAAEPPSEEERRRALRGQLSAFYSELQTYEGVADVIGGTTTYFDRPEWLWSVPERLEAVDPAAMAEVAGSYLAANQRVSVTVVPRRTGR
jgi:zinc protease